MMKYEKKQLKWHVGLCNGRHELKTNDGELLKNFIFPEPVDDPLDFSHFRQVCGKWIEERDWIFAPDHSTHLYLYVTGLTPLLTAFLSCWVRLTACKRTLILMHYNIESGDYEEERWP
tara:strand:+ start:290 stop:643 length:354 start_codon:yes stop_codon:yes gene_type:complete